MGIKGFFKRSSQTKKEETEALEAKAREILDRIELEKEEGGGGEEEVEKEVKKIEYEEQKEEEWQKNLPDVKVSTPESEDKGTEKSEEEDKLMAELKEEGVASIEEENRLMEYLEDVSTEELVEDLKETIKEWRKS